MNIPLHKSQEEVASFLEEIAKLHNRLFIRFQQRYEFDNEEEYKYGVPKNLGYKSNLDIFHVETSKNQLTKLFHFVPEDISEVARQEFYRARIVFEGIYPTKEYYLGLVNSARIGYDIVLRDGEVLMRIYSPEKDTDMLDLDEAVKLADKIEELKHAKLL